MPTLGPTMKIFYRRHYTKRCVFGHFPAKFNNVWWSLRFQISEKWSNLRFPLNIQKQKVFQLQGGFMFGNCRLDRHQRGGGRGGAAHPECCQGARQWRKSADSLTLYQCTLKIRNNYSCILRIQLKLLFLIVKWKWIIICVLYNMFLLQLTKKL